MTTDQTVRKLFNRHINNELNKDIQANSDRNQSCNELITLLKKYIVNQRTFRVDCDQVAHFIRHINRNEKSIEISIDKNKNKYNENEVSSIHTNWNMKNEKLIFRLCYQSPYSNTCRNDD